MADMDDRTGRASSRPQPAWWMATIVATLAFVGLVPTCRSHAGELQKTQIHVASSTKSVSALPITVARAKGYLADENIELTIDYFSGGPPAVAALLGGSVQVLSAAFENNLKAVKIHQPLVSVANVSNDFGGAVVIRKDLADKLGHAPSVTELKGLRIGTLARGGLTDSLIRQILRANGIDPVGEVTLFPFKSGDRQLAAGDAGEIDANIVTEPWPGIAVDKLGKWAYVGDISSAHDPEIFRDLGSSTLQLAKPYLEKNAPVVEGLVRAIVKAQTFLAQPANFDEVIRIAAEEYSNIDPDVLRQSVKYQLGSFRPDLNEKVVAKNVALLTANGQLELPAPTYAETVDTRFKAIWASYNR